VTVPEATMDEDYFLPTIKHNIGITWQFTAMQTEPKSTRMQELTHSKFWLRIHLFNARHALGESQPHKIPFVAVVAYDTLVASCRPRECNKD
jgi:hypothetical protein